MSQQINLLRPREWAMGPAIAMGASVAVLLLVMGIYYQAIAGEASRLRAAANAKDTQLAQLKEAVTQLQVQKTQAADATALNAEIAGLRPRAEAATALLKDVRSGSLGTPDGLARYYRTLASVSENGVWITNAQVTRGGTVVTLSGRSLRNESIMQYAARVNQVFAPYGVHFDSLEITPELASKAGGPSVPSLSFKLS